MNLNRNTQWSANAKIEEMTISYAGKSEGDIPEILANLVEFCGGPFDAIEAVDEALYKAIVQKDPKIVDIRFDADEIDYHMHVTRATLKIVKKTPTIPRAEFAKMIGRQFTNVIRTLSAVGKLGIQVPPPRHEIPIDLAKEVKARIERDGKRWIEQWKIDIAAIEASRNYERFEFNRATVCFDKASGVMTISTNGMTPSEQNDFMKSVDTMLKIAHGFDAVLIFK